MSEQTPNPGDDSSGRGHTPEGLKVVHCRRTGQDYDCGTHVRCPYCFGAEKDVKTGEHEKFCDFDPKHDPVSFGFPQDSDRYRRG